MENLTRRTVVKSAAWSIPVIATAVAMPLTSASVVPEPKTVVKCTMIKDKGQPVGAIHYSDGTVEYVDNPTAMTEFKEYCNPGHNND